MIKRAYKRFSLWPTTESGHEGILHSGHIRNDDVPHYLRHIRSGVPIFVTVVTRDRRPWLADPPRANQLLESMRRVKSLYPFRHHGHVILPDHFHWMITPDPGSDISQIVGAVKRHLTWRLKERPFGKRPWQKRFYDHVIRNRQDFGIHLDYLHFNPVRHQVARSPFEYPFSSFRAWVERDVYTPDWGSAEEPGHLKGMDLE